MPVITTTIGGSEYRFAPLKIKEARNLFTETKNRSGQATIHDLIDTWGPYIKISAERAGSAAPDLNELDSDVADEVLTQFMDAVMRASGVRRTQPGEAPPMTPQDRGTISSAS